MKAAKLRKAVGEVTFKHDAIQNTLIDWALNDLTPGRTAQDLERLQDDLMRLLEACRLAFHVAEGLLPECERADEAWWAAKRAADEKVIDLSDRRAA